MNKQTYHRYLFVFGCVLVSFLVSLSVSERARAAERKITFTTDNYEGGAAIQEALDWQSNDKTAYDHLTIVLEPGAYDMTESLLVYSNTTIRASGDSLIRYARDKVSGNQGRAPLISNACAGKGGYTGAGNITIEGGIWDFQGHPGGVGYGITMEAFRFMHGRNIQILNVTMQNLCRSHFLTIEGVEQVEIRGCVFQNYTDRVTKKEAIHIDCIHNSSMAPSNQENVVYDDTLCNQITIYNCKFSNVPRGIGSHIAVSGLFPSDIVISNNTFTDITYEAIKAYHYKNVLITGNTIVRAGCGIKCYLYTADSDKDEEGSSNYLTALPGVVTEGVAPNLNVVIQWNTIQDIRDSKLGFGIHLAGGAYRVIKDVTVANNVISSSQVTATKRSGIYVKYAENIRLTSNVVQRAGGSGILIASSRSVAATQNRIHTSSSHAIAAQDSNVITLMNNTVQNAGKRGIYLKNTGDSRISGNTVQKDKTGGIGVTANSTRVRITSNRLSFSGKNAVSISDSPQPYVYGNVIQSSKKFGIYTYRSDAGTIKRNTVKKTGSTAIIASTGKGTKVEKNEINQTGKYGILFTSAKKCSASKNTIRRTKKYGIIFSSNSKNKKQNLNYPYVKIAKDRKELHGYAGKKIQLKVTIGKWAKTVRTKKNGSFSIKIKKLKKKKYHIIQVKDKLGNVLQWERGKK